MKLPVKHQQPQFEENRSLRAILTLIFLVAGVVTGAIAAQVYISILVDPPDWLKAFQAGSAPSETAKFLAYIGFMVAGALTAFLVSSAVYRWIMQMRRALQHMSAREVMALFLGLVFGLLLTLLLTVSFRIPTWLAIIIALILCYLSITATTSIKEQLGFFFAGPGSAAPEPEIPRQQPKLVDTNVIIDGRILDICRTGFVEGPVFIPRFVLDELQHIADSSDALKRARGRRGLDILNQMRKELGMKVSTYDHDGSPLPDQVDAKLVAVAQQLDAAIITNDFNLNKVAELQGVTVLNVNELANSLKPVVLPGEEMSVTVIREGKEPHQGVAYLDDGTMVVIENARRHIGERVDVQVASVWQTVAGKMIFANLKGEASHHEDYPQDRGASQRTRRH
ncbi:MAG: TRAM domain-containing protein [Armatimonadetes bacterium]|nr:TRAM domain-containing protein [Armatimonadota bacterium]